MEGRKAIRAEATRTRTEHADVLMVDAFEARDHEARHATLKRRSQPDVVLALGGCFIRRGDHSI